MANYNTFIILPITDNVKYYKYTLGLAYKKEARGINDDNLGEVQHIEQDTIITKAGVKIQLSTWFIGVVVAPVGLDDDM